ncbi:O-methyltransferase [Paenibacillus crassostreae]|uniref:O-methyltransferase n=1 Tax=Paenibacillus crassostreae TaxID=1763538 RepID=A0A167CTA2_9BACL|nr:O-methyltransferase [Paenibacillus crassostreae]AOZ93534.1 O-methyltransferase [Paenibacillus crassostreae]OAB73555.1 O-methyltransferase [Paenibacillus crassostreae]
MIKIDQLSLARQMDIVFKELEQELAGLNSGTLFMQIRNNVVGKFGIRQNPIAGRNGSFPSSEEGLNAVHQLSFRNMAIESLKYKYHWTHGEISYDFTIRQGILMVDAILESNYNMANLMIRYSRNTYQNASSDLL